MKDSFLLSLAVIAFIAILLMQMAAQSSFNSNQMAAQSSINFKLDALATAQLALVTTQHELVTAQRVLSEYVRSSHDFEIDQVSMLEKVTNNFNICNQWVTSVDVFYKSKFATVSVSHVNCMIGEVLSVPVGMQSCAHIDMSFTSNGSCPKDYALNISEVVQASGGAKVVSFGWFGLGIGSYLSSSWVGHVASTTFSVNTLNSTFYGETCSTAFSTCGMGHQNSIIVNGDQMSGMSGSIVVSERGIVGMSTATLSPVLPHPTAANTRPPIPRHRQVLVTPLINMQECLNQHMDLLTTNCPSVKILNSKIY